MITPSFSEFEARYDGGQPVLVSTRLVSDLETPVSAFLKLTGSRAAHAFLLESVEGGAVRGRYSIIGLEPDVIWRCDGAKAFLNRKPAADPEAFEPCDGDPLSALRRLVADSAIPHQDGLPPMAAGVFGYLGYDMVRLMERLPDARPDPIGVPDAILMRPTLMAIFDSVRDEIIIVTPVRPQTGGDGAPGGAPARAAYEAALERLDTVVRKLETPLAGDLHVADDANVQVAPAISNTSEAEFHAMVARAKDYILSGDIFQVVLSQRFEAAFTLPPFALYRALRRVNPAPFLSFLDFGQFQLVCSSPEILVRVRDGNVTIRPIAGTRPRGETPEEDRAHAASLLADEKERAEHLMLLDLGRNDVGRVAAVGSVTVKDRFFLEYYSHVMHIVSHVEGVLDASNDTLDALVAGFPAGTVSGAPKVRAMEIIDELERDKRGPYGGCIGYFGADGALDTCIVLRTAIVKDGRMHVQAGAGIVHDSVPDSEQRECVNKAKALFRAAEEAVRFASRVGRGQ